MSLRIAMKRSLGDQAARAAPLTGVVPAHQTSAGIGAKLDAAPGAVTAVGRLAAQDLINQNAAAPPAGWSVVPFDYRPVHVRPEAECWWRTTDDTDVVHAPVGHGLAQGRRRDETTASSHRHPSGTCLRASPALALLAQTRPWLDSAHREPCLCLCCLPAPWPGHKEAASPDVRGGQAQGRDPALCRRGPGPGCRAPAHAGAGNRARTMQRSARAS